MPGAEAFSRSVDMVSFQRVSAAFRMASDMRVPRWAARPRAEVTDVNAVDPVALDEVDEALHGLAALLLGGQEEPVQQTPAVPVAGAGGGEHGGRRVDAGGHLLGHEHTQSRMILSSSARALLAVSRTPSSGSIQPADVVRRVSSTNPTGPRPDSRLRLSPTNRPARRPT